MIIIQIYFLIYMENFPWKIQPQWMRAAKTNDA